ncbi:AAA family ATPase [Motiliproteus sediminis]|uniref:AAA family ATPase n=1 Tax=Motiliproteus sediminis TaxID=1468178 RepID=UPI001AEFE713|nr:MoxR family ATPase [Motiliproteus sediminis]
MTNQQQFQALREWLQTQIIGQQALTDRLLIALLADGHLLVEGAPGLAKTKAIKTLAMAIEGDFHRVQFTPDLLPADITGSDIYRPETHSFEFQPGPLFHNLILADEINRAPAKVQSALLEAMAERQISIGKQSYPLPSLFLVMATQNPIEQEGTYPLPEAQLDRFLMQVNVAYPNRDAELAILRLARQEDRNQQRATPPLRLSSDDITAARAAVQGLYLAEPVERYMVELILASRDPGRYAPELARWIEYGASPRATIALERCARAHAWLHGQDYVSPDNVQAVAHDVLRHRLLLSFEAQANGQNSDAVIQRLLEQVPVS